MKMLRASELSMLEREFIKESLPDFGWSVQQFESEWNNEFIRYWFLKEDQNLKGYVAGQLLFGELEVLRVYVHGDFRGQHLGKVLLNKALADVDSAFLEVRSQHQVAIKLYQSVGFEIVSLRENYYSKPTDDAVNMVWRKGELYE